MRSSAPSPAAVLAGAEVLAGAIRRRRAAAADGDGDTGGLPAELRFASGAELDAYFLALAAEAERSAVLSLVASVEGLVRESYLRRIGAGRGGRGKDALSNRLRELGREHAAPNNVGFRRLLQVWRDETTAPGRPAGPVNEFLQIVGHRNWLAHGRVGPDLSGLGAVDLPTAAVRCRGLLTRLDPYDEQFAFAAADLPDA